MERNSSQDGKLLIGSSYEFEYLEKVFNGREEAPNPSDERTTSSIFSIFLSYSVNDKLTVEGVLPWRDIVNAKNNIDPTKPPGLYIRESSGFSDALLLIKYSDFFFDDQFLATIGTGIKFATGDISARDSQDEVISETLQLGSGTLDPMFSLFLGYPNGKWLFSGSLFARLSMYENVVGYKYGNEFHTRISVNYDKSDAIFYKAGLESVVTQRDTHQYGEPEIERGGEWVYFVPGVGIRFAENFILDMEYPWTIYYNVNESQLVPDGFFRVNLFYDWSLK
tara:strand:+ start:320 stop:1159 length:840 start_codon:yes stop_codon:yes gene_type:complete